MIRQEHFPSFPLLPDVGILIMRARRELGRGHRTLLLQPPRYRMISHRLLRIAGEWAWPIVVRAGKCIGDTTPACGEELLIPTVAPIAFRTQVARTASAGSRPCRH